MGCGGDGGGEYPPRMKISRSQTLALFTKRTKPVTYR